MDENKMARAIERRRELADRNVSNVVQLLERRQELRGRVPDGRPARRQRRLDRLSQSRVRSAESGGHTGAEDAIETR